MTPITYTNRQGSIYYLHLGKTKKGNPKYYFSLKSAGELVYSVPDGYEIYENPNARVFLRRIQQQVISDEEVALVRDGIKRLGAIKYFKLDVKKETIYVHTADDRLDDLPKRLGVLGGVGLNDTLKEMMLHYMPVLLFKLVDQERRLFITKRYCFRGSTDDWIDLGDTDTLEKQVERFAKHLGRESFFDLI